jgi:hypothetical protein
MSCFAKGHGIVRRKQHLCPYKDTHQRGGKRARRNAEFEGDDDVDDGEVAMMPTATTTS